MVTLRLAQMLKKRKLTRYRFALLMRVDYKNSARWFKAGYDPKLSTLAAWAKILKCRVRDLIKE